MIEINAISDKYFSILQTGVTRYFPKNFNVKIVNNNANIFNKYDDDFVIVVSHPFTDISINGTTYLDSSLFQIALLDVTDSITSTNHQQNTDTRLAFGTSNEVTAIEIKEHLDNYESLNKLGWAQYNDGQYTEGFPLVITEGNTATIDINGFNTIKTHLPDGVTDLYDVTTSKIKPVKIGDGFAYSLGFKGKTDNNNGRGSIFIDIGDGSRVFENLIQFPRGINIENPFYFSTVGYQLINFFTNGGLIKFESEQGTTSIYDITLQVHRNSIGK